MESAISCLKSNGIVLAKTDTLYGILGKASSSRIVERIYKIKHRKTQKPFIILIAKIDDLEKFGISVSENMKSIFSRYWPGPTSIIVDIPQDLNLNYLDRGAGSLAFRLPKDESLIAILRETGPLVAPSANPEGETPAINIVMAQKYFGDSIDLYYDSGECLDTQASQIIKISESGSVDIIRSR